MHAYILLGILHVWKLPLHKNPLPQLRKSANRNVSRTEISVSASSNEGERGTWNIYSDEVVYS